MSDHLNRDELLSLAEAAAPLAASHHARTCAACAAEVAALRRVLEDVRSVEVPEPSPLFWDAFSARVRHAVASEDIAREPAWRRWPAGWWLSAGALAAACALAVMVVSPAVPRRGLPDTGPVTPPAVASSEPPVPPVPAADDAGPGEDFDLVADLASTADEEAIRGLAEALSPGSAETAASTLSDEEQRELVRMLQRELGARASS